MIVLAAPGRPALPVGKVVAVGRNWAAHAREMGAAAPDPEPILFLKPASALVPGGGTIELPDFSREVHHEVELVVRVARDLRGASLEEAAAALDAVAVGLDLTARDLQRRAKERGDPWSVAKGFDGSAPLSALAALDDPARLRRLALELVVNGELRQAGRTAGMVTPVVELVAFVSRRMRLEAGDLLFTGTPEGVAAVRAGDRGSASLREDGVREPLATLEVSFR